LGFTHNNQKTFPRLAEIIGFCKPRFNAVRIASVFTAP